MLFSSTQTFVILIPGQKISMDTSLYLIFGIFQKPRPSHYLRSFPKATEHTRAVFSVVIKSTPNRGNLMYAVCVHTTNCAVFTREKQFSWVVLITIVCTEKCFLSYLFISLEYLTSSPIHTPLSRYGLSLGSYAQRKSRLIFALPLATVLVAQARSFCRSHLEGS